jgi:abhydrolase domain-containing protein 5
MILYLSLARLVSLNKWFMQQTESVDVFEKKIFECLTNSFDRYYVSIGNSNKIWTVSANVQSKQTPIVLIHGFCGSIGFWVLNFDRLCGLGPLYAFDLLGFGRSSRPEFSDDPIVLENEFIDSIEAWRKALNISQMIIVGHSFGGFLSASYALKYPGNVKATILVEPWGFPEPVVDRPIPVLHRVIIKLADYMTPFSIMRKTGLVGLNMFKRVRPDFKRKFISVTGDSDDIYDYIYYCNKHKPT